MRVSHSFFGGSRPERHANTSCPEGVAVEGCNHPRTTCGRSRRLMAMRKPNTLCRNLQEDQVCSEDGAEHEDVGEHEGARWCRSLRHSVRREASWQRSCVPNFSICGQGEFRIQSNMASWMLLPQLGKRQNLRNPNIFSLHLEGVSEFPGLSSVWFYEISCPLNDLIDHYLDIDDVIK